MTSLEDILSIEKIKEAHKALKQSDHYIRTPVLYHVQKPYGVDNEVDLYLKLENLQVMGSFKVRGVFNQMRHLPEGAGTSERMLLAMSAGNYGKAFAYLSHHLSLKAKVLMPDTAPDNREVTIKKYGAQVERMPVSELLSKVEEYTTQHNMVHLHSYDDPVLIQGHASLGLEILEDIPDPDIVVVCCGGGGILSGTAAAIKQSGCKNCKIYGVEPQGSRTMYESYKAGHAVAMRTSSIASGLSPPSAGTNAYKLCRQYVEDILLVTDGELMTAMMILYNSGQKVEASGAAAFAALYFNKIPDTKGKKVVVVVTGGNVTIDELSHVERTLNQTAQS